MKIGSRVICIKTLTPNYSQRKNGAIGIKKGHIDIIREIHNIDRIGLLLENIKNGIHPISHYEYDFEIKAFRELCSDNDLKAYKKQVLSLNLSAPVKKLPIPKEITI